MRSLLALLRPAWLGLFGLHAIRGNVVAGKKSCLPAYFSGRMGGFGAALLLAAAAGGSVFDIRSNAQTATSAPAVAVDTITTEEAVYVDLLNVDATDSVLAMTRMFMSDRFSWCSPPAAEP